MHPCMPAAAALLLDRHYNSLLPYRKGRNNMYAVRKNGTCAIRYIECSGNHLVLRPHNATCPVEVIPIDARLKPCDYIVGRVCHVGAEM